MKLKFEAWVEEQNFSEVTKDLFSEGATCYKSGAYRASLLLSFLGLQSMIKERVLEPVLPKNYQPGEWKKKKRDVGLTGSNSSDDWDKGIQELVKIKDPKKTIFGLNDDIHHQYFYWKDRRNDCAHARGNTMHSSHVESFWLFIQSNSHRFVVNGGHQYILDQLKEHYDKTITPPGQDPSYIVKNIANSIEKSEYESLFDEIKSLINTPPKYDLYPAISIWKSILKEQDTSQSAIEYLIKEENYELVRQIIKRDKELVSLFFNKPKFIRKLWTQFDDGFYDYDIFIVMLRNNLIPKEQHIEAFRRMFDKVDSEKFSLNPYLEKEQKLDEGTHMMLDTLGFFKEFHLQAFVGRRAIHKEWAFSNTELIVYYIHHFGLNDNIVKVMNVAFRHKNIDTHFANSIVNLYSENDCLIKKKHKEISDRLEDTIPESLR
jgi:hypothetical protein